MLGQQRQFDDKQLSELKRQTTAPIFSAQDVPTDSFLFGGTILSHSSSSKESLSAVVLALPFGFPARSILPFNVIRVEMCFYCSSLLVS